MSYAHDMSVLQVRDTELASALRISVMRLARRLRAERAETGLSLTQLSTLAALERHGPSTPGALAEHEKVQPPSMTRIVAGLEERGLVERSKHPTDGRQVVVAATDAARVLLRADRRRREEWLSRRLAELTPEERDALRAVAPLLERLAGS
jgi:DNA-binding MarR family transcriptional regulator